MNQLIRYMTVFLVLATCAGVSSEELEKEAPLPRLSFEGLEKELPKGVPILGTLFRTRTGDYINFVPVEPRARGVWTRGLTSEVKKEALQRIKPQQHVPVIALCDITTKPANPPAGRPPGITTGAYHGPFNVATVTETTYLTKDEAAEKANELIEDEAQRTRFLARFK
jgi:hypothetical protein